MMDDTEHEMSRLGEDRPTLGHMRMFLSRLAMQFHSLAVSALNGTYHETDGVFFGQVDHEAHSIRLRALVHQLNTRFAERIRNSGQKRKVCVENFIDDCTEGDDDVEHDQLRVTESEMRSWVREVGLIRSTQL